MVTNNEVANVNSFCHIMTPNICSSFEKQINIEWKFTLVFPSVIVNIWFPRQLNNKHKTNFSQMQTCTNYFSYFLVIQVHVHMVHCCVLLKIDL